jgi:hypothetical protein
MSSNHEVTPESVLRDFLERYGDTPVLRIERADGRQKFLILFGGLDAPACDREVYVLYPDSSLPERVSSGYLCWCNVKWFMADPRWVQGDLRDVPEALLQFVAGTRLVQKK